MAQDLKDTLQLPKTDFPMRAGLAQREPGRVAHWEKIGLYEAIQRKNANGPCRSVDGWRHASRGTWPFGSFSTSSS